MRLAKVGKRINELKGDIADLQVRIKESMRTLDGNDFPECFDELELQLVEKTDELIKLKVSRMKANIQAEVYEKILRLGETKGLISFIDSLNVKTGLDRGMAWNAEKTVTYKSQISVKEKQQRLAELKEKVRMLSDELDEFNAQASIEVE